MKKIEPIDLAKAGLAMAKAKQDKLEEILTRGPRINKKQLHELRKEVKAIGFKVEGKYGPDGKYHVYLTKGSYRRQAF